MFTVALTLVAFVFSLAFAVTARYGIYGGVVLLVVTAPWSGVDVDVGLHITLYRVVLGGVLIGFMAKAAIGGLRSPLVTKTSVGFVFFVVFMVLWSLVQAPFVPHEASAGGTLRSPVIRAVVQIVYFLIAISPIFFLAEGIRKLDDLVLLGKAYLVSVGVLALLGWMQVLMWHVLGTNPLPIGVVNEIVGGSAEYKPLREGIHFLEGVAIPRMSSLAGEPRDLGTSTAIALIILQSAWVFLGYRGIRLAVYWVFLLLTVLATLSASGLYVWFIGSIAQLLFHIYVWLSGPSKPTYGAVLVSVVGLGAFVVSIGTVYFVVQHADANLGLILTAFNERVFGRDLLEEYDAAILRLFEDQPVVALVGVGLGNIHLYARPYLSSEVLDYAQDAVFVARNGVFELLSEGGLLALGLFSVATLRAIRGLKINYLPLDDSGAIRRVIASVGVAMFSLYLARAGYVEIQFFLTIGLCIAASLLVSRSQQTQPKLRVA